MIADQYCFSRINLNTKAFRLLELLSLHLFNVLAQYLQVHLGLVPVSSCQFLKGEVHPLWVASPSQGVFLICALSCYAQAVSFC